MSRFGPLDNPAPLMVFHNAMPPTAGNEASYNYWPVHVAATQNIDALNNLVPLPGKQVALLVGGSSQPCRDDRQGDEAEPDPAVDHSRFGP